MEELRRLPELLEAAAGWLDLLDTILGRLASEEERQEVREQWEHALGEPPHDEVQRDLRTAAARFPSLVDELEELRGAHAYERDAAATAESVLADARATSEMWESWAGSLRDALDGLVRATAGHLGDDHPLITRSREVMRNG